MLFLQSCGTNVGHLGLASSESHDPSSVPAYLDDSELVVVHLTGENSEYENSNYDEWQIACESKIKVADIKDGLKKEIPDKSKS